MSQQNGKAGTARAGLKWLSKQLAHVGMECARCKTRPDLPWTADMQPDRKTLFRMEEVCAGCPVFDRCSVIGVSALGGMYAGVWLPWKDEKGTPGVRTARSRLRERVGAMAGSR